MYNLKHNNYHQKPKPSNIQTPPAVSQFIFELLRDKIPQDGLIFDPCCGKGNLLEPWKEADYQIFGMDIKEENLGKALHSGRKDFLALTPEICKSNYWLRICEPALILCNPPFNGYGNKLGSEVWLDKIIELFGKDIPIVLFAPDNFYPNSRRTRNLGLVMTSESQRHFKFQNGTYPKISSQIALPKNIFEGVIFHSEILIFNVKDLEAHYFFKPYEKES